MNCTVTIITFLDNKIEETGNIWNKNTPKSLILIILKTKPNQKVRKLTVYGIKIPNISLLLKMKLINSPLIYFISFNY